MPRAVLQHKWDFLFAHLFGWTWLACARGVRPSMPWVRGIHRCHFHLFSPARYIFAKEISEIWALHAYTVVSRLTSVQNKFVQHTEIILFVYLFPQPKLGARHGRRCHSLAMHGFLMHRIDTRHMHDDLNWPAVSASLPCIK
jgi:hypothetical protein